MTWTLWLDDQYDDPEAPERHTPREYVAARSTAEAQQLVLERGLPQHMDLDHDLGGTDDAMTFLKWLSQEYPDGPVPSSVVHSANPVGATNIRAFLDSWRRSLSKVDCGRCGRAALTRTVQTTFPYGSGEDSAEIPVALNVHTCIECGEEFLTSESEAAKEAAVAAYFLGLTRKVRSYVKQQPPLPFEVLKELATEGDLLRTVIRAKLFQLLCVAPKPKESKVPEWAEAAVRKIQESGEIHPTVANRTMRLLGAVCTVLNENADYGELLPCSIGSMSPGRLEIQWTLKEYLKWIISPCEMPYPGVEIQVYEAKPDIPHQLTSKYFYDVPSLLEHLKGYL